MRRTNDDRDKHDATWTPKLTTPAATDFTSVPETAPSRTTNQRRYGVEEQVTVRLVATGYGARREKEGARVRREDEEERDEAGGLLGSAVLRHRVSCRTMQ